MLREVALIACEDTRRTRALLSHFDIHTPTISYFEHNKLARGLRAILEEVMLEIMYELPSIQGLKECIITREVIMNHEAPVLVSEAKEQSA